MSILGYGSMGKRHASNAKRLGHDVTIFDTDRTRTEQQNDFRVFGSEDEAFGWDANAMVIATPARDHAAHFWRACRPGTSVLVEKPLALSTEQFWREGGRMGMAEVGPRVQMVGYNQRFNDGLNNVRRMDLPRVGRPSHAQFYLRCDRAAWPGLSYDQTILECSHEIDLALWFLGPARMMAATSTRDGRTWRIDLNHQHMECHSRIEIDDSRTGCYERGGEILGSTGAVRWSWHAPTGRFTSNAWGSGWSHDMHLPISADDTYVAEIQAFLWAVTAQTLSHPSYTDGLAVLDVIRWAEQRAALERGELNGGDTNNARG